jgi:hypothetical protein
MAFVSGTVNTLCVSLIVAVSMERTFVAEFFSSAYACGKDVIDLDDISILEEPSTPSTGSLLLL